MVTPDHTQWQTHTHSKIPLNEGSTRRRDLYLTTRNTQQTSTPLAGFVPTIRASELLKTHAWIFVCCECLVLSGRGLCDELITRPEESYRLWCVVVWSRNIKNRCYIYIYIYIYIYDISSLRVNDLNSCLLKSLLFPRVELAVL